MKEHLSSHKTTRMAIKIAEIDVAMVPIIHWMNENHHGITLSCCHGHERPTAYHERPYITFFTLIASEARSVHNSIQLAGLHGEVQLEILWQGDNRLYRLTFKDRPTARRYAKFLKEHGTDL